MTMSEAVKIVIVTEGGSLHSVLSCGVPVTYAAINYPDKSEFGDYDDDDFFDCPQLNADAVEAVGHMGDAETENPGHALAMFDAVAAHHGRVSTPAEGPAVIPYYLAERARCALLDLIDEAKATSAWQDAENGQDAAMLNAVQEAEQAAEALAAQPAAKSPHDEAMDMAAQIARMKNSIEADGEDMGNDEAMDGLILWARNIINSKEG